MSLWDAHYNYTNADLDDIYEDGKERGKSIANQVAIEDMPKLGEGNIETEDELKDTYLEQCAEAEENNRQFSPFEFIAKEINEREDAEDAWHEFDQGIADGFEDVWQECTIQVDEGYARERVRESLDQGYGAVHIAGNDYYASQIVENLDPIKMNEMISDWADHMGWELRED